MLLDIRASTIHLLVMVPIVLQPYSPFPRLVILAVSVSVVGI